jgi:hypothetical protein
VDPEGDEEWTRRIRDENEGKQQEAKDSYRYARAAYLELRQPREFYEIDIDRERLPPHLEGREQSIASTMGQTAQEFAELPIEYQLIECGRYSGFGNVGSSFKMTRLEAREALGEPRL